MSNEIHNSGTMYKSIVSAAAGVAPAGASYDGLGH